MAFSRVSRFYGFSLCGSNSLIEASFPRQQTCSSAIFHDQDIRNSWIEAAAFLPAPMAAITVAAPVAISPPAHTLSLDVLPVALSMTILPFLPMVKPVVVAGINGLGPLPIA
jgi:hypothetical protein